MPDPAILILITATFVLAGAVKGVVGLGLPTVALGVLTATLGLQSAMTLMLVPSLVTNIWQVFAGGHTGEVLRRIWPFLLAASVTIWFGAAALVTVDTRYLTALLGILVVVYAVGGLLAPPFTLPRRAESWAGPLFGACNGVFTGMTGSFVFPGVLYLQALGLKRDALIQAMGMTFSVSTLALGVALGGRGLMAGDLAGLSVAAVVPALAGMVLGQKIRKRLPEARFRRVFFIALILLGAYMTLKAVA